MTFINDIEIQANSYYFMININCWVELKKYINSIQNGDLFTRQELIKNIYGENNKSHRYRRIDVLRRQLELTGFIAKTSKLGVFIKLYNIPENLTTTRLCKIAYGEESMNNSKGSIFDYV